MVGGSLLDWSRSLEVLSMVCYVQYPQWLCLSWRVQSLRVKGPSGLAPVVSIDVIESTNMPFGLPQKSKPFLADQTHSSSLSLHMRLAPGLSCVGWAGKRRKLDTRTPGWRLGRAGFQLGTGASAWSF